MVFTVNQTTAFFENAAQMGLSNRTREQLQAEGIDDVIDIKEWDEDDWDQFASNCKSPPRIPDPANPANLIYQQPFAVSVKSLKRLKLASALVRFYVSIDRAPSAANMQWAVIENFTEHNGKPSRKRPRKIHPLSPSSRRVPLQPNGSMHGRYSHPNG